MAGEGTPARRSPARRKGRSWQIPLSVAVIAISAIAVWRMWPDGSDPVVGPDLSQFTVNAEVTTFWVDHGYDLVEVRWRPISVTINQAIAIGQDCLPSNQFESSACSEIVGALDQRAADLRALVDDARRLRAPPESTADEWLVLHIAAWERMIVNAGRFANLARDGFTAAEEPQWMDVLAQYQTDAELFTQAEFQLARVIAEVSPDQRRPR